MTKFIDFWPGFEQENHMIRWVFSQTGKKLTVLGPFQKRNLGAYLSENFSPLKKLMRPQTTADFFLTGENYPPQFSRARKQIGFWRSLSHRSDVLRFPYWKWYLDWPEIENPPTYRRFGTRLSIKRLMLPIEESYSAQQLSERFSGAVMFSKHFRKPRRRFYELTDNMVGCAGFGGAFGKDNRLLPKMPILEQYRFCLCPENGLGDGYITEKIPEAFYSGNVPISWCRPEDLAEDFNPKAVVNLYGLNDKECSELLKDLKSGGEFYRSFLREPLLLKAPSLKPLLSFVTEQNLPS